MVPRLRAGAWVLVGLVALGCARGAAERDEARADQRRLQAASAVPAAPATPATTGAGTSTSLTATASSMAQTAAERAARIRQTQEAAPRSYRIETASRDRARAVNRAHGFVADFNGRGVALQPSTSRSPWRVELTLARVGCAHDPDDVRPPLRRQVGGELRLDEHPRREVTRNRVDYAHGPVTEWYLNGPLGLEHGFTITEAPPCSDAAAETLALEVSLGGDLQPGVASTGDAVVFHHASGLQVLRYGDLFVVDATGRQLPARLTLADARIAIRVETAGAVYPIAIDPLIAFQQRKLEASDEGTGDQFGLSVDYEANTALVGARYQDNVTVVESGAAYVFVRSGTTWTQQAKLMAADRQPWDHFGSAVALHGEWAAVGAPEEDGHGTDAGAAYIFSRSGSTWTQRGKVYGSDTVANDRCGTAVVVWQESVSPYLVRLAAATQQKDSQRGAVYVFRQSGGSWVQEAKLVASDGAAGDFFGGELAVADPLLLVGAMGNDDLGSLSGSAYVFARSGTSWSQRQKLLAPDGAAGDRFGSGVAIDLAAGWALIGADGDDDMGSAAGAAYAYAYNPGSGLFSYQQKIVTTDPGVASFGEAVGVSGTTAVVGADWAAAQDGRAYVYEWSGSAWVEQATLQPADAPPDARFGVALGLSGYTTVIGAPFEIQGAAYVFEIRKTTGTACGAGSECQSGQCVDGVCCSSSSCSTCQSCNVSGHQGSCWSITEAEDPDTCSGAYICDYLALCKLKDGQPCPGGFSTCASRSCQDNYCCSSACDQTCERCDVTPGTCTAIPNGQDPHDECTGDVAPCGGTCDGSRACYYPPASVSCGDCARCDGAGTCSVMPTDDTACGTIDCDDLDNACRDYDDLTSNRCKELGVCKEANSPDCTEWTDAPGSTLCLAESCTNATYYEPRYCDGAGVCVEEGTTSCGLYQCVGAVCGTSCAADGDCVGTAYCDAPACLAKKPQGSPCGRPGECLLGACVDGVCCSSPSCGTCEACNLAGSPGTCAPVALADDPDSCAAATSTCDASGACRLKNGQPCVPDATACASDVCADGVCCTSACDGLCESCNLAGQAGTCAPIAAGTDPIDECTGDTAPCGGTCNGARGCQYPSPTTRCGLCQACDAAGSCGEMPADDPACDVIDCDLRDSICRDYHDLTTARCKSFGVCKEANSADCNSFNNAGEGTECEAESCVASVHYPADQCDGYGTCVDSGSESCGLFLCSGSVCATSCSADGECVATAYCNGSACVSRKSPGSGCGRPEECLSGSCVDGVCCSDASCGLCEACNLAVSPGSCAPVINGDDLDTCTGTQTCDPTGACKLKNGQSCAGGATTCASGVCADKLCCNAACTGLCEACDQAASLGTCSAVASGQDPEEECDGTGTCGGTCNGARSCQYPGSDVSCGTCQRCDGSGACGSTPIDDETCGVIDCDGLDQICRDYNDLTSARCKAFGECKEANSADCTSYANASASTECEAESCVGSTHYPADQCDGYGICVDSGSDSCGLFLCNGSVCASSCSADGECVGTAYCNGSACVSRKSPGSGCGRPEECLSGSCVDGVCCSDASCGSCEACNLAVSPGSCAPVTNGDDLDTCTGTQTCDPTGACKLKNGQSCAGGATTCASGVCADELCCNAACTGLCEACDLAGSLGTCAAVASGEDPEDECPGETAPCGGTCNGARSCQYPSSDISCGTCQRCDGSGACGSTPIDDETCGVIDCDGLDRICRDYNDLTSARCKAFGECKEANSADCTSYANASASTECEAESCVGSTHYPADSCNGSGTCVDTAPESCGLYACHGTVCGTSCSADGECVGTAYCDGATCAARKPSGTPCQRLEECVSAQCVDEVCCADASCDTCEACNLTASLGSCAPVTNGDDADTCTGASTCNALGACSSKDGQACPGGGASGCAGGVCADGVCCNVACAGECVACDLSGAVGTCANIPAGQDPGDECAGSGVCGGACNGAGACDFPAGEVECAPGSCIGYLLTEAGQCDGEGGCDAPLAGPCAGGFVCSARDGDCLTTCAAQAHCQPDYYCDTQVGACKRRSVQGTPCGEGYECQSGYCVDGYCCEGACDGECERCDVTAGSCTPVADGQDPDEECPGSGDCGGVCDGARACRFPGSETICREQACTDGVVTRSYLCDGTGRCLARGTELCEGFACDGVGCRTSCVRDDQCAPGWTCDVGSGTCTGGLGAGAVCRSDGECQSGSCAGGYCCADLCVHLDPTCGGRCDAAGVCSYPAATKGCGTCRTCDGQGACLGTPADDATCGTVACSELNDACATYADVTTDRCRGFGQCKTAPEDCAVAAASAAGTACGEAACVAAVEIRSECDGAGACVTVEEVCLPYLCVDETSCGSGCAAEDECAAGRTCDLGTGTCRGLVGDQCGDDGQCQGGLCTDGVCCEERCHGECEECEWRGTCVPVAAGADPDEECAGTGVCGGTCDGARACQYPGSEIWCDLCTSCDGAGACGAMLSEDPACAGLACTGESTECRLYSDLESSACAVAGECEAPTVASCAVENEEPDGTRCACASGLPGECRGGECYCPDFDGGVEPEGDGGVTVVDAAAVGDGGAGGDGPGDTPGGGCGCRASHGGPGVALALLLLLGGLLRRRRFGWRSWAGESSGGGAEAEAYGAMLFTYAAPRRKSRWRGGTFGSSRRDGRCHRGGVVGVPAAGTRRPGGD